MPAPLTPGAAPTWTNNCSAATDTHAALPSLHTAHMHRSLLNKTAVITEHCDRRAPLTLYIGSPLVKHEPDERRSKPAQVLGWRAASSHRSLVRLGSVLLGSILQGRGAAHAMTPHALRQPATCQRHQGRGTRRQHLPRI